MSLDILLADDAPRDALNAIIEAHPAGDSFVKPMLRYIGLFSPAKSQMGHSRMASLLNELAPMIRAARIERNGRTWICPIEYWRQGFEHMLAQRDQGRLNLPLKSHGYLLEVLAGIADKAESRTETHTERQRQGHAGLGTPQARASPADQPLIEVSPQPSARVLTPDVNEALKKLRKMTREINAFSNGEKIDG
ncbi:hypothetical protein [Paraburkholderia sp.]|uniref:hypothetical protein n=1 Tax=Paraburkholderia sp. TaxID=1926495 RepID=UPI002D368D30|nr:hypothetical protein [Paraburkholderia sp.]HZZ04615.1 hypothetical protein [Paraburkholderia sp.]